MDPENQASTPLDVSKEGTDYVQHEQPAREGHTCWYVVWSVMMPPSIRFVFVSDQYVTLSHFTCLLDIAVVSAVIPEPPVSL